MEQANAISSGSLRTKISLKGGFSQVALPFYGMKSDLPRMLLNYGFKWDSAPSNILGSDDLIARFDLSSAFQRFCGPKKPKEDLASFLTNICGTSNLSNKQDACSSLKNLVDKPPITGKEIIGLSSSAMIGFKLSGGPIPENYRLFNAMPGDASLLNGTEEASKSEEVDPSVEIDKHKKRLKRTLDDFESPDTEKRSKKHRNEEKEKKQKKKKEKKDKKKKRNDEEGKRVREIPFY